MARSVRLVYRLAPGEGPEPKQLVRHRLTVIPEEPWRTENLEFARQLIDEYPQIEAADSESRSRLEPKEVTNE